MGWEAQAHGLYRFVRHELVYRDASSRVAYVSVSHGGGFIATIRGARGALVDAKDFWGPLKAREAREWVERRMRQLRRRRR